MVRTVISILGLAIALYAIGGSLLMPDIAQADSGGSLLEQKTHWQNRYRALLSDSARLQDDAIRSRENYARAQKRNYPRGGARQQFIIDAEEAEEDLVKVKSEIEQIFVEARRAAVPPSWLYEVDDEAIKPTAPASASDDERDPEDTEGRNPLYLKDDGAR
jgi:hypothetical protein